MEEKIRLQKAIAQSGYCSRRKAEELIISGKVKVNGIIINEYGFSVGKNDVIEIDGKELISQSKTVAFLFNKPTGVLSTAKDDRDRKTVLDYFKDMSYRLYPAGRLDMNTSGAIIITNDGELANLIMHPSSHLEKTYIAKLNRTIDEMTVDKLEKGVVLDDGLTAPAKVKVLKNDIEKVLVKISIHEGRNRQVRRMFEACGYHVKALHRDSIGFLNVKDIERGSFRSLTNIEIESLKNICKQKKLKNIIPNYKKKN